MHRSITHTAGFRGLGLSCSNPCTPLMMSLSTPLVLDSPLLHNGFFGGGDYFHVESLTLVRSGLAESSCTCARSPFVQKKHLGLTDSRTLVWATDQHLFSSSPRTFCRDAPPSLDLGDLGGLRLSKLQVPAFGVLTILLHFCWQKRRN